jgi:hypothetical protein
MPSGFGRKRAREQQRVRVDGNGLRRAGRLAYRLAGRPGYEAERVDVQQLAARREARYVA